MKLAAFSLLSLIFASSPALGLPTPQLASNLLVAGQAQNAEVEGDSLHDQYSEFFDYLEEIDIRNSKLPQNLRILIPHRDGEKNSKQWVRIYFPDNLPEAKQRRKTRRLGLFPKLVESCSVQKEGVYMKCLLGHVLQIQEPHLPVSKKPTYLLFPVDETPITFDEGEVPPPLTSGIPKSWSPEWLKEYFHNLRNRSGKNSEDFRKFLESFSFPEVETQS